MIFSIDRIKKNPLNRAVRIDKFTLSSLESVLRSYYDLDKALRDIPTLRMISESPDVVRKRAQKLSRRVKKKIEHACGVRIAATSSRVGGGALPEYNLDSWAVELQPTNSDVSRLERDFRGLPIPIIGRIEHDRFLLDIRTVQDKEISELAEMLISHFSTDQ